MEFEFDLPVTWEYVNYGLRYPRSNMIYWIGPVPPKNAKDYDLWEDTLNIWTLSFPLDTPD